MNKLVISSTSAISTSTLSTLHFASNQNTTAHEIIIKENNVMILLFSLNLVLVPVISVIFLGLCCVVAYFIFKRKGNLKKYICVTIIQKPLINYIIEEIFFLKMSLLLVKFSDREKICSCSKLNFINYRNPSPSVPGVRRFF